MYVYDRVRCLTARISLGKGFVEPDGGSRSVAISGDGRFIYYSSDSSNVVERDTNLVEDVFATRNPLFVP
ncbi:MAG: hypothetical protein U0931_27535 [Vulcanimicrobiota bacterium]